jgi:hypothetical protein
MYEDNILESDTQSQRIEKVVNLLSKVSSSLEWIQYSMNSIDGCDEEYSDVLSAEQNINYALDCLKARLNNKDVS